MSADQRIRGGNIVRRTLAGVVAATLVVVLAWGSLPASASAAVSADPKVVLVVGATHGTTPTYRAWMDVVAATASRYSRNVVTVYSPNATWTAVRAALQGASVVVYMGHGNGFPSPYTTALNPASQDGMGLNAVAGAGDSNTKYYGESYLANEVRLAPNAVVILSHNCYASGNSEPGGPEPSLAVAKARIDNFAAGFLRAGARAVIADGHGDPSWYITQLFTTRLTVAQIWQGGPRPNGNTFSFPSSRTPGFTAWSDPDVRSASAYTGFYRSLVGVPSLTTVQVTGASYAPTDGAPATFVVPGAAEVGAAAGVGLYPDATLAPDPSTGVPAAMLPAGTRLRILASTGTAPDGAPIFQVATLDGSASGFAEAAGLAPRDSTPPRIWLVDAGTGAFSPNGDGSADSLAISAQASEGVTWNVSIAAGDRTVVRTFDATGAHLAVAWDGLAEGSPLPDGTYAASFTVTDPWGNAPATTTVPLVIDTVKPTLTSAGAQSAAAPVFTPNGDGISDAIARGVSASEAGTLEASVRNASGGVVDTFATTMAAGSGSVTWDGRTSAGAFVPGGTYKLSLTPVDLAGNHGTAVDAVVVAYPALGFAKSSVAMIYARDRDRLAKSTTFTFRLLEPATVTWQLFAANGTVLLSKYQNAALAAGTYAWAWDGRLANGAFAGDGWYTARVTATDGVSSVSQQAQVMVGAFRIILSDTTPARGQLLSVRILATEPMRWTPVLTVSQPGRAAVRVALVRVSAGQYRATFRLSRAGRTGSLVLRVTGYDTARGYNVASIGYPLH